MARFPSCTVASLALGLTVGQACGSDAPFGPDFGAGTADGAGSGAGAEGETGAADDGADRLDVAVGGDGAGCSEGGDCPECEPPPHAACDDAADDLAAAVGLGCAGEHPVTAVASGSEYAMATRTAFGATSVFDATEGARYLVLGTGQVAELDDPTPDGDETQPLPHSQPTFCNDDLGVDHDRGTTLPEPMNPRDVGTETCLQVPDLIGTGDCSNTLESQLRVGESVNDYTELRVRTTVPDTVTSLSFDFAFLSTEYPYYHPSTFNDMFVTWLESEQWTGNISFDPQGNAVSLNASFLEFRDDVGDLPELADTCMRHHAASRWLTTTAGVTAGEDIELVFAIFDLSDSIVDSFVFLDDFAWGCEQMPGPTTVPVG